jgi:hypothetical protein
MMIRQETPQEREMRLAPGRDPLVIVAIADRPAYDEQQHIGQRMRHPPRFARVFDNREMIEQLPKARLTDEIRVAEVYDGGSRINAAQRNHTFQQALDAVNPSSEPWVPFCPAGLPVVPAYCVTFQDRGTGSRRCGQA